MLESLSVKLYGKVGVSIAKVIFIKSASVHVRKLMVVQISLGKFEVKKDLKCKKEMQNNQTRFPYFLQFTFLVTKIVHVLFIQDFCSWGVANGTHSFKFPVSSESILFLFVRLINISRTVHVQLIYIYMQILNTFSSKYPLIYLL